MEYRWEEYLLSDEKSLLSMEAVFGLLSKTYWAKDRPIEKIEASIENSLCWGLFHNNRQIGLARIVTDNVSVYYLCDVVIDKEYRKKGLGSFMLKNILRHFENQNMKGLLVTRDAQEFYKKFGFNVPAEPILMLK
ncbi:MAG TPA: GNAT family N-acetyltransferase [Syntrophomonadaceae bacterium]|nr:GNAT family N-acetyltransferase [Syntrophomonadaceae bacterium]HRX21714.1 GNAT family N-acetyltransferase [Syntrophomonadaceae bacterium]